MQNQEKIIQAIVAYLGKVMTYNNSLTKIQFERTCVNGAAEFIEQEAKQIAAAIAPHLEVGAGWEDAPSWAEWRTVDGNGDITYWKDKPEPSKRNDYWTLAKGDRYEQIPHTVKDWKETLQKRPR